MKTKSTILLSISAVLILLAGFKLDNPKAVNLARRYYAIQQKKNPNQLKDNGIGPIKEVKLGPLNQNLVDKGNDIYNDKCSLCHNIDDVNLAPQLRGVTKALTPVFIMNYLMNTKEMQQKDPYVKKLIQQWKNVPAMKDQKLKEKEARAVLEFLRSLDE